NFDYSELEHHLAMTRDGEEKTKAARIIERVKSLSTPYFLSGENFRNN
ncbi:TPA: primosomal protein DnaI, partial [Staphylococcus aureus]|nr:primosomal protein DnaI [Staphylococcus aureus]